MLVFKCVIVLPELEHGDEVRRLVFVSGVLVVGGVAFLEGPFARVLHFEERCNDKRLTEKVDFWGKLEDRLIRELAIDRTLKTPVNFIVHTLQEVNDGLAHGRYFFMDVARDGIALYEYDDKPLHTPKPKTPQQALAMAREYFEEWYPSAMRAHVNYDDDLKRGWYKEAAFMLHQATERLYHGVLLVCTFYTPLCRVRHNGVYAERSTMPSGAGMSLLSPNFAVIGSA